MWRCPECKEFIEYVSYSADTYGKEWGTIQLRETNVENETQSILTDWETDENETNGTENTVYRCPECDNEINESDLIWKDETDEEDTEINLKHIKCAECILNKINCTHVIKACKHCEKELQPEETLHNIIKPLNNIVSKHQEKEVSKTTMVCKYEDCKYIFVYEATHWKEDEFYECPKCERTNSKNQYLLKLEKSTYAN